MAKPRECRYCHKLMEPLKPGEHMRDHECCSDECREEWDMMCLLDEGPDTLTEGDQ